MSRSRGFIIPYVVAGLVLLSLTMMMLARMNVGRGDGERMANTRDELVNQASLIRAKLIACTVQYPGGDNGLGYRPQLPSTPATGLVSDALCPGNPGANKSLWTASDGIYAPRTLMGLSAWRYTHDATSARISVTAVSGGHTTTAALTNAALRFGAQASVTGTTLTIVIAN